MHPPFTGLATKTVPPEGDVINGFSIPGGTRIGTNYWGVQRSREIYGDDVEMFRPERWLEASGEKLSQMERTVELVFSYGRYSCLGRPVVSVEMNKLFVEVRLTASPVLL